VCGHGEPGGASSTQSATAEYRGCLGGDAGAHGAGAPSASAGSTVRRLAETGLTAHAPCWSVGWGERVDGGLRRRAPRRSGSPPDSFRIDSNWRGRARLWRYKVSRIVSRLWVRAFAFSCLSLHPLGSNISINLNCRWLEVLAG